MNNIKCRICGILYNKSEDTFFISDDLCEQCFAELEFEKEAKPYGGIDEAVNQNNKN